MNGELGYMASVRTYLRKETFPSAFCSGCGHGILGGALLRAIYELGLDMDKMVFVSGIGCSGWIPSPYFAADTLHVTHGRTLAFAAGVEAFRPDLKVVAIGGDGDLASIGTNHLLHAARRSHHIATVCANNGVYGMTGGHVTPTTPLGARTYTTPAGNPYRPMDLCRLMEAAGATYVARHTVYHTPALVRMLKRALLHEGFSFVDVISPCPTQFGRRNRLPSPWEMMQFLRENAIPLEQARERSPEELEGKIVVGEFVGGEK